MVCIQHRRWWFSLKFNNKYPMLWKYSTAEQQGAPSSELPSTSPASVVALSSRSVIHKPFTQSRIPPDLPMHPAPRHITEEELSVLESCLHRWRTEIENDTRGKELLIVQLLLPLMDICNIEIEKGKSLLDFVFQCYSVFFLFFPEKLLCKINQSGFPFLQS